MILRRLANHVHRRLYRRKHHAVLERWSAARGDERLRLDYPLDERALVLDVGGYEGRWAEDIYARYRCRIAIFEPVRRFAEAIRERFKDNPKIEVFPYGLAGATRAAMISVRGAGSSTLRRSGAAEEIRLVDVAQWLKERGIDSVQLMKINIEGGEFELLERLIETGLIATIENLQVQFHNFEVGAPKRMAELQAALGRTHTPTYQYEFVWENWARRTDRAG